MGNHRGSAGRQWAALSKEERKALPPDQRAAILVEIQAHQAEREAINRRKATERAAQELLAEQALATIRADVEALRRKFEEWDREAAT